MFREIIAAIFVALWFISLTKTGGKFAHTVTDEDTGCQYVVSWYGMPGVVRLDEEGLPMGCKNLKNHQNRPER